MAAARTSVARLAAAASSGPAKIANPAKADSGPQPSMAAAAAAPAAAVAVVQQAAAAPRAPEPAPAPAPGRLAAALHSVLQARSCEAQQARFAACVARESGGAVGEDPSAGPSSAQARCREFMDAFAFCEQQMLPFHFPNHPHQFMV